MSRLGWICPKCNNAVSPDVQHCVCYSTQITTPSTPVVPLTPYVPPWPYGPRKRDSSLEFDTQLDMSTQWAVNNAEKK